MKTETNSAATKLSGTAPSRSTSSVLQMIGHAWNV